MLQETGVATAPGIDFDPVEGHHFIRLSFAASTARCADLERLLIVIAANLIALAGRG